MMRKSFAVVLIGLSVIALSVGRIYAQGACDRACLEGFVDKYLDALIAHDPKAVPIARNEKFTENGVRLDIGESQWKTVIGKGTYRLFVTDAEAGQVAFIGTVREEARGPEGTPTAIALHLKVENRQITEI